MAAEPRLLDVQGRPVRRQGLTREIAEPGLTGVRHPWGGTVASGLTPSRLATLLQACDQGEINDYVTLAEEMEERDPHYSAVLGVRKRAVSGVAPAVTAAGEDAAAERIAQAVRERIAQHPGFPELVEDMMDAVGKGFSVIEIVWARDGRAWWPGRFEWRSQRHFRFDRETLSELRLRDMAAPAEGLPLEPYKFVAHVARLKSGLPARGGLARVVAFAWMCKAYALKDWMAFAETYGLPLRLGRYGPEATKEDVQKLFTAVANIGTDAAAVLPKSMEIDFTELARGTGDAIFENLARYLDEQVSKAVLGQTMTSDDGSSRAQAEVHDDVRHDIAASDARAVAGTLNRDLVKPFVDLNFGVQAAYPRIAIEIAEPEDVGAILDRADKLIGRGLRVKARDLRARLRLGDPDDDDEVIGGTPVAPPATARALARADVEPDPFAALDEIEAEMLAEWEEVTAEALAPVEAAIAGAADYEDAQARLAAIPGLPASKLIDALVQGAFKARALGDGGDT